MLLDFSASVVPNRDWASSRPKGTTSTFVDPKGDSGQDRLSIARGEGRSGGDCLLVESPDERSGLPGFWIMRGKSTGRSVMTPGDRSGYLVRNGERANRLAFDLRFDAGFRAKSSVKRAENLVIGTYHFDPAKIGTKEVKESDNWHFYHQLLVRHDLADGDWIRVVVNDTPQHQRSLSQYRVPQNPTTIANYWEIATRLYIDCTPYGADPEIPRPVRMFVDNIQFFYEEPRGFDVQVPSAVDVSTKKRIDVPIQITNLEGRDVTGTIAHRSRYSWEPRLCDEAGADVHQKAVTIAAGESREFRLSLHPRAGAKIGMTLPHGIIFVPQDEQRPNNASIADPRVFLNSTFGFSGSCDSNSIGATTQARIIE